MFIDISMHDELNERNIGADGITIFIIWAEGYKSHPVPDSQNCCRRSVEQTLLYFLGLTELTVRKINDISTLSMI